MCSLLLMANIYAIQIISKMIPKNLILVSSIVADWILILVKCNSILYEKIIYFVLAALIEIQLDVSQLLTFLSSLLRVNVVSRSFSSANEVDEVLSSANSTVIWIKKTSLADH